MVDEYKKAGEPKKMNVVCNLSQNFFNGKFTDQIEIIEFESANIKKETLQTSEPKKNEVLDELEALLIFN